MNGKALNSEMYLNLVKGLIGALNSGNAPNNENTLVNHVQLNHIKFLKKQINYMKKF